MSTRYGTVKQLEAVGPNDATLMDYSVFDALRAGATHVVLVVRTQIASAIRAHSVRWLQMGVELSFVFQKLEGPDGAVDTSARQKPWGTAHAVLVAASEVNGPFAVCNADDFYGRDAFEALAKHLWNREQAGELPSAVVGYRLSDTLSQFGGVSRALCECGRDGFLKRIVELKNVTENRGGITADVGSEGSFTLSGNEIVSTNLWGFTPAVMRNLEVQFKRFLEQHAGDRDAEFLLSTAINEQLAADALRVKVLPTSSQFLGVTFPNDRASVVESIAELVSSGHYPADLWTENR